MMLETLFVAYREVHVSFGRSAGNRPSTQHGYPHAAIGRAARTTMIHRRYLIWYPTTVEESKQVLTMTGQ